MNSRFTLRASIAAIALLALPLAQAANMDKAAMAQAKTDIATTYKAERAACDKQSGNAKDICVEEAKAHQKVAKADLQFKDSGKPKDENKLKVAKAEADYAVAREKCDDQKGKLKDVCVQEAKAAKTKAVGEAKMQRKVVGAESDANDSRRKADLKVALEKCELMSGQAKSDCDSNAKAAAKKP